MDNWTQIIQQIEGKVTDQRLTQWYDRHVNLQLESNNDDLVDFGEILPIDDKEFIKSAMEEWVNIQVPYIKQLRREIDDPFVIAIAFSQRGITYNEFKYVMSGKRPKDYKNDDAFFYLHIINEEAHDRFIATTNDNEKDLIELYLERISLIIKVEIPILQSFFFFVPQKLFSLFFSKKTYLYFRRNR